MEQSKTYAETVLSQAKRCQGSIRALQFFLAPVVPQMQSLNLCDVARVSLNTNRSYCDAHRITVVEAIPEQAIAIEGDNGLLQPALDMLQKNAFAALSVNVERPCLTLRVRGDERWGYLVIEDNGPGPKVEKLETLYSPLYTTRGSGLGLGIPTVRSIMQALGGTITLDSVSPTGLRVQLKFPLMTTA